MTRIDSPSACSAARQAKISARDQRRQALGGLVEDQQRRVGHQRPADRQHLLLAAGELAAAVAAALGQAREQAVDAVEGPARRAAAGGGGGDEVLLDAEGREHLPPLGDQADPGAGRRGAPAHR